MRYMDKTKMFLKLGWRIFVGNIIRFKGGFKNDGQVVGQDTFILAKYWFNPGIPVPV